MAERVIKFRFEGDASGLEREMRGVSVGLAGVGSAAKAAGDVAKTAIGVGLGLSLDKVREKLFQALAAYARWFAATKDGAAATKRLTAEGKKLRDQFFKPLNAELANSIDQLTDFITKLDPAALDAYARGLAQTIAFFSDLAGGVALATSRILGLRAAQGDSRAEKELETNRQALNLQSQRIEGLRQQIAMQKDVDEATNRFLGTEGETSDQVKALTADLERQIGVLRRLKGEIGEAAGLRTVRPTQPAGAGGGGESPAAAAAWDENTAFLEAKASMTEYARTLLEKNKEIAAASKERKAAVIAAAAEEAAAIRASVGSVVEGVGAALQDLTSTIGSAIAEEMATTAGEIEALEERITNTTDAGAKRRLLIQKSAKEKELEDHKKAAMAAWAVGHVAAIAQAAVAIPLTIAQTLANMGATPVGIALAVAGGITAGVALAAVIAEPPPTFHAGGLVTGGDVGGVAITARRGERVLSNAAVSRLGNDTLDEVERGRMPGGRGGPIIRFNDRDLDVMHSSRLRAQGSPLNSATASATRSRYSSGKGRTG